jgi:hypothetical protein
MAMGLVFKTGKICRALIGGLNTNISVGCAFDHMIQVDLLRKHVDTLVDDPLFDGLSTITRGVEGAASECKQSFEDYKQKK